MKMQDNKNYIFEYLDENDFRKKERSVIKYNMLAYKKLTFTYYPELRKGNFLGKEVKKDEKNKTSSYELQLPTDELFKKVHGPIVLHYTVYKEKNIMTDSLRSNSRSASGRSCTASGRRLSASVICSAAGT